MTLTQEQLHKVLALLDKSSVTLPTLRDDLFDHLCCSIECRMTQGSDFENALAEALKELAPYGLNKIQIETNLILFSPNIDLMKKLTYSVGLVSSMMMAFGWVMNILHWPGSGSLSTLGLGTYGFMSFVILFLPMLAIGRFRESSTLPGFEKTRIVSGLLSGFITVAAVIFKIFHMNGAHLLMIVGAFIFIFCFLPFQFYAMYKKAIA